MHEIYTDQQAVDILLTEGHGAGDIAQELDIFFAPGSCSANRRTPGC